MSGIHYQELCFITRCNIYQFLVDFATTMCHVLSQTNSGSENKREITLFLRNLIQCTSNQMPRFFGVCGVSVLIVDQIVSSSD